MMSKAAWAIAGLLCWLSAARAAELSGGRVADERVLQRADRLAPARHAQRHGGRPVAAIRRSGDRRGPAIKRASPFATTLVIELCNDAPGYVPTRKAFAEGSYETVNSRIAPGGGEMMVDLAVRLLTELKHP